MMPYVMRFNRAFCEAELAEIGAAIGLSDVGPVPRRAVDVGGTLFAPIGIPGTIANLGVKRSQLPLIVEQALGSQRIVKNNPRPLDGVSMALLVDAAFSGAWRARLHPFRTEGGLDDGSDPDCFDAA